MNFNFQIFRNGWESSNETPCGYGSELDYTEGLRKKLPGLIKELVYHEMLPKDETIFINDAGCGDKNWISHVDFPDYVDYMGYDLFCRDPSIVQLDITSEVMRESHLILCRDVFIHLPNMLICKALNLFRQTSKLLLSTTFANINNYDRQNEVTMFHQKLNLDEGPFFLGPAMGYLPEPYVGKFLGLWKLQK